MRDVRAAAAPPPPPEPKKPEPEKPEPKKGSIDEARTGEPIVIVGMRQDGAQVETELTQEARDAIGRDALFGPGLYFTDDEAYLPAAGKRQDLTVTLQNPYVIDLEEIDPDQYEDMEGVWADVASALPNPELLQRLGHDGIIARGGPIVGEDIHQAVVFPEAVDAAVKIEKPAGQPSAPEKPDAPKPTEKPEVPEAKTTSIPAGMSGGGMRAKSFYYGDEEWEVFDGDLDPVDAADAAYSMWSGYDGNFQMRHVSAALMGQETPAAYGDEVGPKEINQILSTGKWEGQPEWAKEQAKESVQWATFIMDQVVNGEKTERPLYRGLSDVPDDADILNYKPGDTFTIPLSAFSPDQRLAEQFSTGTGEGKSVIIVVEPGARGYKAPEGYETQFEENGKWVEDSIEYVTNGDFEVVRTQNARGQTIVTLRHLQTYNSSGSRFSVKAAEKSKKRIPTWAWTFAGGSMVKRVKPNVGTRLGGKRKRKGSDAK
jgi:hypothetical protein